LNRLKEPYELEETQRKLYNDDALDVFIEFQVLNCPNCKKNVIKSTIEDHLFLCYNKEDNLRHTISVMNNIQENDQIFLNRNQKNINYESQGSILEEGVFIKQKKSEEIFQKKNFKERSKSLNESGSGHNLDNRSFSRERAYYDNYAEREEYFPPRVDSLHASLKLDKEPNLKNENYSSSYFLQESNKSVKNSSHSSSFVNKKTEHTNKVHFKNQEFYLPGKTEFQNPQTKSQIDRPIKPMQESKDFIENYKFNYSQKYEPSNKVISRTERPIKPMKQDMLDYYKNSEKKIKKKIEQNPENSGELQNLLIFDNSDFQQSKYNSNISNLSKVENNVKKFNFEKKKKNLNNINSKILSKNDVNKNNFTNNENLNKNENFLKNNILNKKQEENEKREKYLKNNAKSNISEKLNVVENGGKRETEPKRERSQMNKIINKNTENLNKSEKFNPIENGSKKETKRELSQMNKIINKNTETFNKSEKFNPIKNGSKKETKRELSQVNKIIKNNQENEDKRKINGKKEKEEKIPEKVRNVFTEDIIIKSKMIKKETQERKLFGNTSKDKVPRKYSEDDNFYKSRIKDIRERAKKVKNDLEKSEVSEKSELSQNMKKSIFSNKQKKQIMPENFQNELTGFINEIQSRIIKLESNQDNLLQTDKSTRIIKTTKRLKQFRNTEKKKFLKRFTEEFINSEKFKNHEKKSEKMKNEVNAILKQVQNSQIEKFNKGHKNILHKNLIGNYSSIDTRKGFKKKDLKSEECKFCLKKFSFSKIKSHTEKCFQDYYSK
jgi:hypothetical protein